MKIKHIPLILFLLLISACSQVPPLEDGVSSFFEVGDEWVYQTRPGEGLSTFIVIKIDKTTVEGEPQTIIHIAVTELTMAHPDGGLVTAVPHMPFTEAALSRSALQPFDVIDPIPQEYLDAYQNWRQQYETGDAAVFDVTLAHDLDNIQATLGGG